jgi:hypothetical protein
VEILLATGEARTSLYWNEVSYTVELFSRLLQITHYRFDFLTGAV